MDSGIGGREKMKIPLKEYIKLLSKYLKEQKRYVAILGIILASDIALQLVNPQIIRYFIDAAKEGKTARSLTIAALIFIGAAIVQQFLNIGATYISQNVGWEATNALREDLMEHCINLDMEFHKSHQSGELIERVDGDVTALFNFFSKFMLNVLNNIVLLIGILILLLMEDWRIGLSLTSFAFFAMYVIWHMQVKKMGAWVEYRKAYADLSGFLGEQISSTEDIRSSGANNHVMNRFYKMIRKMLPLKVGSSMAYYSIWSVTLIVFAIGNAIAFGVSAYLWRHGIITIGTVYLIFSYTELLARPIEQIRTQLQDLQKAAASISRVKELFNTKPKLVEGNELLKSKGPIALSVKDVSFQYEEGTPVLKNISLELNRGKILGVLGHTGSGKTTLARLLVRLYDVTSGEFCLDGQNINSLEFKELTKNIAYVTQDVQLFNASVRENLSLFSDDIRDEDMLNIIHDIGLTQWYNSLPQGLDTILEPGGGSLSAGEAQLLAFVRVFLKNPRLIILDEATSRLDPITEQLIEKALDKLLKDRTCVIIAHRLWTVQRADDIVILENGTVIEHGHRKELLENKQSKFYSLMEKGIEEVLV